MEKHIFIEKANIIHKDKFDYSLLNESFDCMSKVKIICPVHGVFEQHSNRHLQGDGCKKCSLEKRKITKEYFISESTKLHNNKYDYTKINYINYNTKVKIICPIHGEFEQSPKQHLNKKQGCKKCQNDFCKLDLQKFIDKSNKIHNNKYNYSLVKYINSHTKVKIICSVHGIFEQKPNTHLNKCGCAKCAIENKCDDKLIFIEKANIIHNNKYNYSLVEYKNNHTKVRIICQKHGEFVQRPNIHLQGCGCPHCNESKGEKRILSHLKNNNILFIRQKKFENCKDKKLLPFDFYLPTYNICIEFDGKHHFYTYDYWGGKDKLEYTQKHDQIKNIYCMENNIKLIRSIMKT